MSSFNLTIHQKGTGHWVISGNLSINAYVRGDGRIVLTGDISGTIYPRGNGSAVLSGTMASIASGPFAGGVGRATSGNIYWGKGNHLVLSGAVGNSSFNGNLFHSGKGGHSVAGTI